MNSLFDRLFIFYCLSWCLVHFFRWLQYPLPWINNYLTDFVFVPVAAHISLTFTRRVLLRNPYYHYPITYLLFIACYTALVFEFLLPKISGAYTSDAGDVAAYFLGSLFYYYVHQQQKWGLLKSRK